METFYRSIPEFIVKTDDITKLSNRACDNLKLGDEVILLDGDKQTKYNITSKSVDGMKLANITGEAVVEVIYSKEGNAWSYVETKTTELGGCTSFKNGYYIWNEDTNKLEYSEEVSEDYSGLVIAFTDEGVYVTSYNRGEINIETLFGGNGAVIYNGDTTISFDNFGASDLNFARLTHSFDELDPTLKQIVDDAIAGGEQRGVACTQEQWNAIKPLLDKSLYINFAGVSMIKSATDGMNGYTFGMNISNLSQYGASLELYFDEENALLYITFTEV